MVLRDARLNRANVIRCVTAIIRFCAIQLHVEKSIKFAKVKFSDWDQKQIVNPCFLKMDLRSVFGSQSENFTLANFIDFST